MSYAFANQKIINSFGEFCLWNRTILRPGIEPKDWKRRTCGNQIKYLMWGRNIVVFFVFISFFPFSLLFPYQMRHVSVHLSSVLLDSYYFFGSISPMNVSHNYNIFRRFLSLFFFLFCLFVHLFVALCVFLASYLRIHFIGKGVRYTYDYATIVVWFSCVWVDLLLVLVLAVLLFFYENN